MFLEPAIKLQAEALGRDSEENFLWPSNDWRKKAKFCNPQGNGLEAGLELKFPYVEAEVEASTGKNPTSLSVEHGED